MKLVHTRIVTADVRSLASFYESITGTLPVGSDDYLVFELEGGGLAISNAAIMNRYAPAASEPNANRTIVLDFEVDDVDVWQSRLPEAALDVVQGPTDRPWGNRSMLFRDPDGNLINVYSRIPAVRKTAGLGSASHSGNGR